MVRGPAIMALKVVTQEDYEKTLAKARERMGFMLVTTAQATNWKK